MKHPRVQMYAPNSNPHKKKSSQKEEILNSLSRLTFQLTL
jgi:hypothetical protein